MFQEYKGIQVSVHAALLFLVFLFSGCGYRIHSHAELPFTVISIEPIENRSAEPKLQDRLYQALMGEFLRRGVEVSDHAPSKLSGTIRSFQLNTLSEKNGVAVEYRVLISADFTFTGEDGATEELRDISSPFIISFRGSDDFGVLLAGEEAAEDESLRRLAERVAGALLYR